MAYLVKLTARAERDLEYLYTEIDAEYSEAALEWYRGLKQAILSLEASPNRCPQTPENSRLRHLLYGKKPHVYRVVYRVSERANAWKSFISVTALGGGSESPMPDDIALSGAGNAQEG